MSFCGTSNIKYASILRIKSKKIISIYSDRSRFDQYKNRKKLISEKYKKYFFCELKVKYIFIYEYQFYLIIINTLKEKLGNETILILILNTLKQLESIDFFTFTKSITKAYILKRKSNLDIVCGLISFSRYRSKKSRICIPLVSIYIRVH